MRCHNCGANNESGSTFCTECGTCLGAQSSPKRRQPSYINERQVWPDDVHYPAPDAGAAAAAQNPAKPVLIGILSAIIILAIAFGGLHFLQKDREADNEVSALTKTEESAAADTADKDSAKDKDAEDKAGDKDSKDRDYEYKYEYKYESDRANEQPVRYSEPQYAQCSDELWVPYDLYDPCVGEMFPDSSIRYLSGSEVCWMSKDELQKAINDIYARNGLIFNTKKYQRYYEAQGWYCGYSKDDSLIHSNMNDFEKSNIELLKSYQ